MVKTVNLSTCFVYLIKVNKLVDNSGRVGFNLYGLGWKGVYYYPFIERTLEISSAN